MSDDTRLAEIMARVVRDRRSFEEGRAAGWYVNPRDDLTDREWLLSRVRALAEEVVRVTLMRDTAYDKWDEYEVKQEARIRALEAQAALDGAVVEAARGVRARVSYRDRQWDIVEWDAFDAALAARDTKGKGE
jgi:hypothetical protein